MIEILQWSTLAACGLVAAARVPSALRGNNRTLFYIFALITLAILLSIQAPYVAIDQALGGINVANLILRLVIFGVIYFMGIRISKGFDAHHAYRLITGRTGMAVLALTSLIVMAVFLMMDTAGSSAGLVAVSAKDSRNGLLVEYYGAAGRAYPAYVALVLLPAMASAVRSSLPALVRVAAAFLAVGAVAVGLTLVFPLIPPEFGSVEFVINYTAVLCFVLGLALIGVAGLIHRRHHPLPRTSTAK
ncbi:hypothetical protein [Pseudarthrobacter sulfonivorans]|uniref:hypothetical protein n=1 Tax=Pseudarthrobacter sulfonivorans TaxID=121292 RepID=UPI0021041726|nr:hypothetical protein [Pseudarthrobacter sulfonivorans]